MTELVVVEILKMLPAVPVAKAPGLKEVVIAVAPLPVTAPDSVMVWLPVKQLAQVSGLPPVPLPPSGELTDTEVRRLFGKLMVSALVEPVVEVETEKTPLDDVVETLLMTLTG